MNRYRRLLRDLRRDPRLEVVQHHGHPKVKRLDGQGPIVVVSGSGGGQGRGYENALAMLRRHGMLPDGYAR